MLYDLFTTSSDLLIQLLSGYGFICAIMLIMFAVTIKHRAHYAKNVPTPNWIPYLGNMGGIARNWHRIYDYFVDCALHAGDGQSFCISMPFVPNQIYSIFIGASAENAEHILKTNFTYYEKGDELHQCLEEFMGDGIFNSDGDQWREQRKTASHMFSMRNLKEDMSQVFLKNSHVLISRLENLNGASIDIQDMLFRYTLDSFAEIAFGEFMGCLTTQHVPFATAFDTTGRISNMRLFDPTWRLKRFLNISQERELKKSVLLVNEYAQNVINHRRRSQMLSEKPDLLSRFIAMGEEKGEELGDRYLRDIVMNFIIAGRDTTAIVMSWALFELSRHPAIERAVYEEIVRAYPQGLPQSHHQIIPSANLPLLEAVIYETLRLHPSVPLDLKKCVKDDVLPDGTVVKAGCMIVYAPYIFGRSPRLWGPDVASFRPHRWLEQSAPSQYQFIAFNAGPRLCLGKGVALMEASLLLTTILFKFQLTPVPGQEVTYQPSLTSPIKDGFHVYVQPRTPIQAQ